MHLAIVGVLACGEVREGVKGCKMPLSRERVFETTSLCLLILVSVYTAARMLRDLKSYSELFSVTTWIPIGASRFFLVGCALTQLVASLALVWPRLATIRNGKLSALCVLLVAFSLQNIICFASSTGRSRSVALVVSSVLNFVREGSSRSSTQVGVDMEANICDRLYGAMRESASRYKSAAVAAVLLTLYTVFYFYVGQSIIFARHSLQRELAVEQLLDVFGVYTLLFTVGSYQQNRRVLFTTVDLEDDENLGRVARTKRLLTGLAARAWEGRSAKRNYKDL
mgnify:CR=1 FL=1